MNHINNRIKHYTNQYNATVSYQETATITYTTMRLLQFNRSCIKYWKAQRHSTFYTTELAATATVVPEIMQTNLRSTLVINPQTVSYEHSTAQ
jgi:hypothetical protein